MMSERTHFDIIKECFSKVLPNKEDKRTKIQPLDFIVNLVFCYFGDSRTFSLEAIRRAIMYSFEEEYSRGAFWERLSRPRLKEFLKNIVAELMGNLRASVGIIRKEILVSLGVKGIQLIDSSSITLKEGAKKSFPGTFTSAAIKWHMCVDLLSGLMTWFQLTPGRANDGKCFPDIKSLKEILVIFDLGYYDFKLLYAIENAGGFFLSRLKSGAAIYIENIICGLSQNMVGTKLSLNMTENKGNIIEVVTKKSHDKKDFFFRVIGFWNPAEKCYHWYITNLKAEAFLIYPLYRLRWQIELIFKACKSSLNANQIPSENTNIIESLLLASIAAHLSSHTLLNMGIEQLNEEEQLAISFQRVAKISTFIAKDFSAFLLDSSQDNLNNLIKKIEVFIRELFDPNYRKRETSLMRVYRLLLSPS